MRSAGKKQMSFLCLLKNAAELLPRALNHCQKKSVSARHNKHKYNLWIGDHFSSFSKFGHMCCCSKTRQSEFGMINVNMRCHKRGVFIKHVLILYNQLLTKHLATVLSILARKGIQCKMLLKLNQYMSLLALFLPWNVGTSRYTDKKWQNMLLLQIMGLSPTPLKNASLSKADPKYALCLQISSLESALLNLVFCRGVG